MSATILTSAATSLLRELVQRAGCGRDWVLLSDIRSSDWQSVTFTGERHRFELRLVGPKAQQHAERLTCGLEDAEFSVPGQIVVDVVVTSGLAVSLDGSVALTIEAVTVQA